VITSFHWSEKTPPMESNAASMMPMVVSSPV
jgi:hypothetical protein